MNNRKSNTEEGLQKHQNAIFVRRELSNAVMAKKIELERQGHEVPNTSIYVEGDTRVFWKPEKYYHKSYRTYIAEIKDKYGLNMTEIGIIYTLSFHIGYEDNLLSQDNGDPLRKKDLCKVLDLGQNAVDKYMDSLVSKGLLAKVKIKRSVNYYIDPRIAYQGNRVDRTLLSMFGIKI